MAKTETILTELKINYLTEEQYAEALASGEIVADEIYMTPASGSGVSDDILNDHIADTNNPHEVTAEQIGLGNVDNTADVDKTVKSATKLEAAKNIALTGDVTGSVSFDGSKDVSIDTTVTDISNVEAGVLGIAHGGTNATTVAEARTNLGVPWVADCQIKTYKLLTQINLTNGSETIESIVTNLPASSMLLLDIGASHAAIYPATYGILRVTRGGSDTRVVFEFFQKATAKAWFGVYDSSASTKWTGWAEIGNAEDYLPLDGSVDMSGNLKINKSSYPSLVLYSGDNANRFLLQRDGTSCTLVNQTSDGSSAVVIYPNSKALANRIQLVVDNSAWYDIFGEHNIDLLSSNLITTGAELTSGVSALSSGKIHLVLE